MMEGYYGLDWIKIQTMESSTLKSSNVRSQCLDGAGKSASGFTLDPITPKVKKLQENFVEKDISKLVPRKSKTS